MADAATLLQMRTECRRLANQETIDQANALCTDAEITSRLNRNLRTVYTRLVSARSAGYYRSLYTFSTVAGTEEYALPATFMSLLAVEVVQSTTYRYPLTEITEPERIEWRNVQSTAPLRYQLRAGFIAILPVPRTVQTINLYHVPAYTALVADGDTFDGVVGFEEAAIWRTVAEMQAKDEQDPGYAMARIAEWDERIESMARERDASRPPRIMRTRKQRRAFWPWGVM